MADNSNTLTLTLQIKDDGSVTVDTVKSKIDQLNQSTTSGGKSITDVLGSIKAGWLGVAGAAVGAYASVKQFADAAAEAEQIESRMAFQIKAVGYEFEAVKPLVDGFADSILQTTRFTDEMARQGLGQMMQYTSDISKGMEGVKLAMDMTTQTGMGLDSTVRYVGMAMNGNAEILGRWIPELRDLDNKLGSTATEADKAAYAIGILNEKFGGAALADLDTYAGRVQNAKNQFEELKETLGKKLVIPGLTNLMDWADTLITGPLNALRNLATDVGARMGGSSGRELAGRDLQRQAKAEQEANAKAASLAAAEKEQKAEQKRMVLSAEIQKATLDYYAKEAALRNDRMTTLSIQQAAEIKAIWDKYKTSTDVYTLLAAAEKTHYAQRLEQIRKEKEEEQTAMLSLATMWKGYYDDRISKENEIIGLIKGTGVETTIGAKFEFAGVEEQFRKIAEKSPMLTKDELEKLKATYVEKAKGVLPFQGGEWEEIPVATGSQMGRMGPTTTWGTDYRWRESAMTEQQRQVEAMREESIRRIEAMSKIAEPGAPYGTTGGVTGIIDTFDQTRQKALELQQTIDQVKNQKLQIDTSRLIDAMKDIDQFEGKLINLIRGDYKIQVGVEIVGDELIRRIEQQLSSRWDNRQSTLRTTVEKGVTPYGNE